MKLIIEINYWFDYCSENSNDEEAGETRGLRVYAQNIDLHLHADDGHEAPGALNLDGHSNNEFFQPEPALLDIADGTNSSNLPQEIVAPDNNFYRVAVDQVCPVYFPIRPIFPKKGSKIEWSNHNFCFDLFLEAIDC